MKKKINKVTAFIIGIIILVGTFTATNMFAIANTSDDHAETSSLREASSDKGILFNNDKTVLIKYPSESKQKSYTIPSSVEIIETEAFKGCGNLEEITIPKSVIIIDDYAFAYCTSLKSIVIPDSVTQLGEYAFGKCTALESVIIGDKVKEISRHTFSQCYSLSDIKIGKSVEKIGEFAFNECNGLTDIELPKSVKVIGEGAFSCENLKSVTIGKGIEEIGDYAFYWCPKLDDIYYEGSRRNWSNIDKGRNPEFYSVNIHYNTKANMFETMLSKLENMLQTAGEQIKLFFHI